MAAPLPIEFDSKPGPADQVAHYERERRREDAAFKEAKRWALETSASRTTLQRLQTPNRVSDFVEYRFCYDLGEPVTFHLRPWLPAIYDSEYTRRNLRPGEKVHLGGPREIRRRILLKCSRQVEKSTSLGNKILSHTALIPNFTALYVSSAGLNMEEFADERIDNTIRISPRLKPFTGKFVTFNRYLKRFERNNSKIVMRSAHLNADRIRGIAADGLYIDEVQNFVMGNLPVIRAVLNNSQLEYGPLEVVSGTPLTFDNPIERLWSNNSTQNMWLMRCTRCRHWNPPLWDQVGPRGLICCKCGKALNPLTGKWVRTGKPDAVYEGFHLSRALMSYTSIGNQDLFEARWQSFYDDVTDPNIDEASIKNEIFGISFDSGRKPITEDQLKQICHPGLKMRRVLPAAIVNDPGWPVFLGVDWGEGTAANAYTLVCLGYVNGDNGCIEVGYLHRYMGQEADPAFVKQDIANLITDNRVQVGFCDAGYGWGMIDGVRERIEDGLRRFVPLRYMPSQSAIIKYDDEAHQFRVHRTRWMSKIFNQMLRHRVRFPAWEIMDGEPRADGGFAQDILTIFADRSPKRAQMTFNHTEHDDAFHSVLYLVTAKMWFYGELDEFANA
jgi:hypothetical protein